MFNVYVGHCALEWFKAIFLYREGKATSIKNKNKFLSKISSNECKEKERCKYFLHSKPFGVYLADFTSKA